MRLPFCSLRIGESSGPCSTLVAHYRSVLDARSRKRQSVGSRVLELGIQRGRVVLEVVVSRKKQHRGTVTNCALGVCRACFDASTRRLYFSRNARKHAQVQLSSGPRGDCNSDPIFKRNHRKRPSTAKRYYRNSSPPARGSPTPRTGIRCCPSPQAGQERWPRRIRWSSPRLHIRR